MTTSKKIKFFLQETYPTFILAISIGLFCGLFVSISSETISIYNPLTMVDFKFIVVSLFASLITTIYCYKTFYGENNKYISFSLISSTILIFYTMIGSASLNLNTMTLVFYTIPFPAMFMIILEIMTNSPIGKLHQERIEAEMRRKEFYRKNGITKEKDCTTTAVVSAVIGAGLF